MLDVGTDRPQQSELPDLAWPATGNVNADGGMNIEELVAVVPEFGNEPDRMGIGKNVIDPCAFALG
eukprot:526583-Alexandrium_andersonii.AAC.1